MFLVTVCIAIVFLRYKTYYGSQDNNFTEMFKEFIKKAPERAAFVLRHFTKTAKPYTVEPIGRYQCRKKS